MLYYIIRKQQVTPVILTIPVTTSNTKVYQIKETNMSNNKCISDIDCVKVKRDSNGNPRYVVHFSAFISHKEDCEATNWYKEHKGTTLGVTSFLYNKAIRKSKIVGGKRYRGKDFGGGIVFTSYNIKKDLKTIVDSTNAGE